LVAGWGGCHTTCRITGKPVRKPGSGRLILADAGMAQDQVAAADDAATVTQLLDLDHAGLIQALEYLVRPAPGPLQAFPERGLTHTAPAGAVGICR
jgi:hypothetical protein